jgi:hypothetical protein
MGHLPYFWGTEPTSNQLIGRPDPHWRLLLPHIRHRATASNRCRPIIGSTGKLNGIGVNLTQEYTEVKVQ